MSATRILWGQIVIVLLIVLAAISAATQWTAWRLGFQPQLGHPWFHLWPGMPVYLPPAFFWWWYLYDAYAPRIFLEGAYIAASGGLMSAAVAFGMSIWRARDRAVETYGSARWATPPEVRRAGLLGPDGVVLGRYGGAYLRHDGPEHVLCFAPTRSGKGVGLVVPSLLTWPGSAIFARGMAACCCSIRPTGHRRRTIHSSK
jgi:type IV secretion system protein VirD4